MLQIKSTNVVYRVFDLYIKLLLFVFAGLAGCQQIQVPFAPKTGTSNISWQELTIQRNSLPTSKKPNDDINAEAVELSVPVSTTIPEPVCDDDIFV